MLLTSWLASIKDQKLSRNLARKRKLKRPQRIPFAHMLENLEQRVLLSNNPIAVDDAVTMHEMEGMITIDVLANDSDPDPMDYISLQSVTEGAHGSVNIMGNQIEYVYNYDGGVSDSFTYTIVDLDGATDTATVDVTINLIQNPDAIDDAVTVDENGFISIDVLANDTDPAGGNIYLQNVFGASNGMLNINWSTNQIEYTPYNGFSGTDTFTYEIWNDEMGYDVATVTVTVEALPNTAPIAVDDAVTMHEMEGMITIDVLANDSDPDPMDYISLQSVTEGAHGSVNIMGNQIEYVYNYDGGVSDSFTYTIVDLDRATDTATVNLTINQIQNPDAVDDAVTVDENGFISIDVLANDTDPAGGNIYLMSDPVASNGTAVINWSTNQIEYTPNMGFSGTDTFTYEIWNDEMGYDVATVTVTVEAFAPDPDPDAFACEGSYLACDTFTDSPGTDLEAHVMEVGTGWTEYLQDWEIAGDQAHGSDLAGVDSGYIVTELGLADVVLEADVTPGEAPNYEVTGFVLRFQDEDNFLIVELSPTNNGVDFWKRENGTWSEISTVYSYAGTATPFAFAANTTYHFKVVADGENISAYIDGTLAAEFSSGLFLTATRHGLRSVQSGATAGNPVTVTNKFDNFRASAMAAMNNAPVFNQGV